MTDNSHELWGPLGHLVGTWEGEKGEDAAPADDLGIERNRYRERLVFETLSPVINHKQTLHGLRYATTAWKVGEDFPFHEELGYWLWDAAAKQVMRCFMVPRGVTVIAGGTAEPTSRSFELSATLGSPTYGICSNPFLDAEFKTVRYSLKVSILDGEHFSYDEDTEIQIKGKPGIFHHTDKNTLRRVS